jgi:hypothetical protein
MMPRRLWLVPALAAAWFALLAMPGVTIARSSGPSARARATHALQRRGYTTVGVRCARGVGRFVCHWTAVRGRTACSGTLTIRTRAGHGRPLKIARPRCRASNGPTTGAAPGAGSGPPASSPLFGFNSFSNAQTVSEQQLVGAPILRMVVPWSSVEPLPGLWSWQAADQEYKTAVDGGLRPLIVAFASPCWTRLLTPCNDLLDTGPPDPTFDSAWIDYVRQLTGRFPAAIGIEIWNEPNLDQLFWPKADPVRYTQLLKEAYAAVKSVAPTMPVISGGLAQSPADGAGPGGEGDRTFLSAMYAAGARTSMDAIGAHPYPAVWDVGTHPVRWDPASMEPLLNRLRGVRDANGATSQPIWITEMGESTSTAPGFPAAVSPAQQAADLVALVRDVRADHDVPVAVIHTLIDASVDPLQQLVANISGPLTGIDVFFNGVESGFGVYAANGSPKPAACALSREFHGSLTC